MTSLPVIMVLISVILAACSGFSVGGRTTGLQRTNFRSVIAMEYIPTGLTKAQWDEIKKKVSSGCVYILANYNELKSEKFRFS